MPTVKFMIGLQSQPNKIHLKHFSVCSLTQIWNDLGHYIEITFIISYQNDMVFTIYLLKSKIRKATRTHATKEFFLRHGHIFVYLYTIEWVIRSELVM